VYKYSNDKCAGLGSKQYPGDIGMPYRIKHCKVSTCGAIADIKLHRGYPRGGKGPLHFLGGAQALSGQPEGSLGDAVVIIAVGGDLHARANQLRDATEEDNNDM
jgi:hypothetical protein